MKSHGLSGKHLDLLEIHLPTVEQGSKDGKVFGEKVDTGV